MKDTTIDIAAQDAVPDRDILDVSFLPVGCTNRPPLNPCKPPREVQAAADLPNRLYLGSLLEDSFVETADGWRTLYADASPDTRVELDYDKARDRLRARFTYATIDGLTTWGPGSSWGDLARRMSIGFPFEWDESAKRLLESRFNVRYIAGRGDAPCFIGFPDGAFRTILIPVSSYRLHELVGLLDEIDEDRNVAAPVSIAAVMTQARIDYVRERCADVPDTPRELAAHSRKAVGLPCFGLPEIVEVEPGLEIFAVDRWVYLVHVGCAFRDLERVIEHCRRNGFIGSAASDCAPSAYPDGQEWTALVIPGGSEHGHIRLQYFDDERTRRIAYGRLFPPGRLNDLRLVRDIDRGEAVKRLICALSWALTQPDIDWPGPGPGAIH